MLVSDNMEQNIKNYKEYIISNENHLSFAKNITYFLKTLFLKIAFFKEKSPILTRKEHKIGLI